MRFPEPHPLLAITFICLVLVGCGTFVEWAANRIPGVGGVMCLLVVGMCGGLAYIIRERTKA